MDETPKILDPKQFFTPATIDRLDFITGRWVTPRYEMIFSRPWSGSLLGLMREGAAGRTIYEEFFSFRETGGTLELHLVVMKKVLDPYHLSKIGDGEAEFTSPSDAIQRTLRFSRPPGGELVMSASGQREAQPWQVGWSLAGAASLHAAQ